MQEWLTVKASSDVTSRLIFLFLSSYLCDTCSVGCFRGSWYVVYDLSYFVSTC